MKRRTFLTLLGLAPTVPLLAKTATLTPVLTPLTNNVPKLTSCEGERGNVAIWSAVKPTNYCPRDGDVWIEMSVEGAGTAHVYASGKWIKLRGRCDAQG